MAKNKRPSFDKSLATDQSKTPRVDPALAGEAYPHRPLWKFQRVDLDGAWGWSKITREGLLDVLDKLRSFESMTWADIERKKGKRGGSLSHLMPGDQICKEARARLADIRQDDVDGLYSLHLSGPVRIWGFRVGHVLHLLWWDPDHTVYPVGKRGT